MSEGTQGIHMRCQTQLSTEAREKFSGELDETVGAAVASACTDAAYTSEGQAAVNSSDSSKEMSTYYEKARDLIATHIEKERPGAEMRAENRRCIAAFFGSVTDFFSPSTEKAQPAAQQAVEEAKAMIQRAIENSNKS
jgi:hypothetical protein